jgi:hypothetical protein
MTRHPTTRDLLFLCQSPTTGHWEPDIAALDAWRTEGTRIYAIRPDLFVTMPDQQIWPLLTPAEARHIAWVPAGRWIPDGTDVLVAGQTIASVFAIDLAIYNPTYADLPLPCLPNNLNPMDIIQPTLDYSHTPPYAKRARLPPPPVYAAVAEALVAEAEDTPPPPPPPMPAHVATLVIRDAIQHGAVCPITMDPIRSGDAAVTSCGHVFNATAIVEWLKRNSSCPECRQLCAATATRA